MRLWPLNPDSGLLQFFRADCRWSLKSFFHPPSRKHTNSKRVAKGTISSYIFRLKTSFVEKSFQRSPFCGLKNVINHFSNRIRMLQRNVDMHKDDFMHINISLQHSNVIENETFSVIFGEKLTKEKDLFFYLTTKIFRQPKLCFPHSSSFIKHLLFTLL